MNQLQQNILRTLLYYDIFSYPLKLQEIFIFLKIFLLNQRKFFCIYYYVTEDNVEIRGLGCDNCSSQLLFCSMFVEVQKYKKNHGLSKGRSSLIFHRLLVTRLSWSDCLTGLRTFYHNFRHSISHQRPTRVAQMGNPKTLCSLRHALAVRFLEIALSLRYIPRCKNISFPRELKTNTFRR